MYFYFGAVVYFHPSVYTVQTCPARSPTFISSLNRAITFATSLSTAEGDPTMNFVEQLDPELRVVVEKLPTDRPLDLNEILATRGKMKKW